MQRFIRFISKLNPATIIVALASAGLILGIVSFVLALTVGSSPPLNWLVSFLQNLSAGMFGSAVTFWLINVVLARRENKEHIIEQMGSQVNDAALEAVRIADAENWLRDGSLTGIYLIGANLEKARFWAAELQNVNLGAASLQGVELLDCNLQGADFCMADLQGAYLTGSNLRGADLTEVNLKDAILPRTNLHGAVMLWANLQGADLSEANLTGVNFCLANLLGANLTAAKFDEHTILPNKKAWTSDTDLTRFTDPTHPRFWRQPLDEGIDYSVHPIPQ